MVEEFFNLIDLLDSFDFNLMFGKNQLYPIFKGSNLSLTSLLFLQRDYCLREPLLPTRSGIRSGLSGLNVSYLSSFFYTLTSILSMKDGCRVVLTLDEVGAMSGKASWVSIFHELCQKL